MKEESLFLRSSSRDTYTTTHTEMLFYTLQRAISGISYHDANRIRERGEKKNKKTKRERRRSRDAVTRYVNRRRRWQQQQQRSLIIFIEYDDDIL